VDATGRDNGADIRVDLRAPVRAKPICHAPENYAGPERPLGCIVGRLNIAAGQEDEQLVAGVRRS
jgi:hypothetical protein